MDPRELRGQRLPPSSDIPQKRALVSRIVLAALSRIFRCDESVNPIFIVINDSRTRNTTRIERSTSKRGVRIASCQSHRDIQEEKDTSVQYGESRSCIEPERQREAKIAYYRVSHAETTEYTIRINGEHSDTRLSTAAAAAKKRRSGHANPLARKMLLLSSAG
jgi:hypothetical protein